MICHCLSSDDVVVAMSIGVVAVFLIYAWFVISRR